MLVAIVLSLAAFTAAQVPKPCTTPPQWQGIVVTNDYSKNFTGFQKITYDEVNKRVREVEELQFGADRDFYDVLYLHNMNKEYRVNLKTNKCNVTAMTRPWVNVGVPAGSQYIDQAVIGPVNIPNEHLTVTVFGGKTDEGDDVFGSVSVPDCLPVTNIVFSKKYGTIRRHFSNIVIGLPDPTVFDIPKACL